MTDVEFQPTKRLSRLTRFSICVAVVAILVSVVSGWLAFVTSRRTVLDSVAHESLTVAQSIVNAIEYDFKNHESLAGDRQLAFEHASELWNRTEPTFSGSYLCVIERPGRLAVHTANSAMLGKDVSKVIVDPRESQSRTVLDLLQAKDSLATENINFRGNAQLAGYAYLPSLDSLVVVHVPSKLVEANIRKTALPWVFALALVATTLIPLSIGLSQFCYISAERSAHQFWLGLRRSEQRFRAIFDATFQFIGLMSTDGTLLEANETALKFGGLKRDDVIGKKFWDTPWWGGSEPRVAELQDAVKQAAAGEFVRYTVEILGEKGVEIVDFTLKPVFNADGNVELLVPEGRLITDQKNAELKLAESEARLRAVINSEPECVKLLGDQGELLDMNPAGLAMIEADSLEQVVNKSIFPIIDVEHREAFRAMHKRVMAGETAQLEFGIGGLKGSHRWVDTHASPLCDTNGRIIGHLAVTRDITVRKLAQQQLQFTQFTVDSCSSPIFWIRHDASFFYVNDAAAEHYGYTRDELLRMSVHDIDPSYPKEAWPKYWEDLKRQKSLTFESEMKRKDGTLVPVAITTNLLAIEGQEFVFAFVTDKTERRAAEELVRANEARFRALVENSYDVISMFNTNGRMMYASPSIERVLGYKPTEISEMGPNSLVHPKEKEQVASIIRKLFRAENSVFHGIHRLRHKNGTYRTVEVTVTNLLNKPGVNAFVAIFRDITERSMTEERLRQLESQFAHFARISTMGEIASGIAHEIKQPLHAVANFATASAVAVQSITEKQILKHDLVDDLIEWNHGIKTASHRASEIVQRLRRYSRKTDQRRENVSVVSLVSEAIDLMAFETRRNQVKIETELSQDLPRVFCDRIQVQQVLVNLLQNANQALKQTQNHERRILVRAETYGKRIQLHVSDNGPGVDQDIRGKIFDAFYTTKQNGMGMGLAISRTIVESHGGRLSAEGNNNGGATFGFSLPVATQCKAARQESVDAI